MLDAKHKSSDARGEMTDVVTLIDSANPVPAVRAPHKKREAAEISN
jgi:hypothetical protein